MSQPAEGQASRGRRPTTFLETARRDQAPRTAALSCSFALHLPVLPVRLLDLEVGGAWRGLVAQGIERLELDTIRTGIEHVHWQL